MRGLAVEATPLTGERINFKTKLSRNHHLLAHRAERNAQQFLIGKRTVDLGGIEERDTAVNRCA